MLCYSTHTGSVIITPNTTHTHRKEQSIYFMWSKELCPFGCSTFDLNFYAVTAIIPGYKPKTTHVLLDDDHASADFVLDTEGNQQDGIQTLGGCICNCDNVSKLDLFEFGQQTNVEILFVVLIALVILTFLLVMFKRKMLHKLLNQRHSATQKRPILG